MAALIALATVPPARAQMIDLNGNGMSDVWEWLYGATNVPPNADPDGDGVSNLNEAGAGTNPFNSNSVPRISLFTLAQTNGSITMPAQFGKNYQLQSSTNLGSSTWLVETSTVVRPAAMPLAAPGQGTNLTFQSPAGPASKFYRIVISDTNSDGTGLMNDWEKYQLGLDPADPFSNATRGNNGVPMNDYQYTTNLLAAQNLVTISATVPVAVQPDPGAKPQNSGQFTLTRGGFPLEALTVNLGAGGSGTGFATPGLDYGSLPATVTLPAGVNSTVVSLTPLANTNLQTPVLAQMSVLTGSNYLVGNPASASVVVYPSPTAKGLGLLGQYFTNSSTTYTNPINFNPTNLFLTRMDPTVDFTWTNGTTPNLSNGLYCVRWTGQVQPQYSEMYTFDVRSDDGCRLSINDQLLINKWQSQGATDWTNSILLQAGTHYDLKLEYLQSGGAAQVHLNWYSADQAEQIIPGNCLYATNGFGTGSSNAPAAITSAMNAYGFVGQPFSFTVTAANTPLGFSAANLPPGLSLNNTNGLIAGTPTLAGNYQTLLTASNAVGPGASLVDIQIFATNYSSVVQEIWTGLPGTNVTDIPTSTPANLTNTLPALAGATNYGDNYGERVRGYFIAPVTGNYYFWIAGSDAAQLWISDDSQQVNAVLRAWVTPTNNPTAPGQNGTAPGQWNLQSSQQSGWLSLVAGQQYFIQILHKAGVGTNDNWSVAWLQDPTGTNTTPAGVTPNYLLAPYYPPLATTTSGTLYSANLLALPGVNSQGVGSATLLVNAAGTQATLSLTYTNLTGTPTGQSINSDPYENNPGELIYDISAAKPQANGNYLWNLKATGPLQVSDLQQIIADGGASVVIESTAFANGEIAGHFTLANGSQAFTPPPAPPVWPDDHANPNAAARFLTQATFGPNTNDLAAVEALGYAGWISNQFALPVTYTLPVVLANASADPSDPYPSSDWFNAWWQNSITAPDQLRQRVALALSEILVASENGVLENNATALAAYYDTLLTNAFGNYRTLLEAVTLTPAMGLYLNMQGNNAGSLITGLHANENYAREVNQLFSIGLNRLWPDGSLVLNSQNSLVPTYGQNTVMGFASVFTGWNYHQTNQASGRLPTNFNPPANYTNPMVLVPTHHELGTKLLLDNVMLPPAWGNQTVSSTSTNDSYCLQDLEQAMNSIFNHPNVGPFICRQLIQRLVTSNPSRDYVYRVAQVFNNDGTGVRGDLQAVVQAILLDYEARSTNLLSDPTYGKQREPLLRVTASARAFPAPPGLTGVYTENGNQTITISTPGPHLMNSGDTVMLGFTDTSGNPAPPSQAYSVTVPATNQFTVTAPNLLIGTYVESNSVITVTMPAGHGLAASNSAYLVFTTGGAANGGYAVSAVNSSTVFTVSALDGFTRSGNCLLPRISASGFVQIATNVTVSCAGPHGLVVGQTVFVPANTENLPSMQYQVASIPDPLHFVIDSTNSASRTESAFNLYPLDPPPLTRSGTVAIQQSTWNLSYTDTGATYNLSQSPLRSPTVFNFYYPNYEFPGALASAGLTTPEFQLTSDTSVALAMNFMASGLLDDTGNTNGLSSYVAGSGAIVLNVAPWMTTNFTANAGIPNLVSNLNTLLVAGQLSAGAQSNIVNYVSSTNLPFSAPPTQAQMRDRVRAAAHLILCSPDCTIQK